MNVNELNKVEGHTLQLVGLVPVREMEVEDEIMDPFEESESVLIERTRLPVAEYGQSMGQSMYLLNCQMKQLQDDFARIRFYLDEMDESSLS
ncbi:MAG: hypothetical protein ACOVP4_01385 [Bacteriovoracaceae bacterium]